MIYWISDRHHVFDNIATLADMFEYFKDKPIVACDIETDGLSFMTNKIWSIQFGDSDNQFVVDCNTMNPSALIPFLESKELIFHNAGFDVPFLYGIGAKKLKVFDTYLCEYALTMGLILAKRGLDDVAHKYCGVNMSKDRRNTIMKNGIMEEEDVIYAAIDVSLLHKIRAAQEEQVEKLQLQNTIKIENEFVLVLAYIEYCGMGIDADEWMKRVRRAEYEEYGALLALKQEAGADINWDSPKQVLNLFREMGINVYNKKEDKESVDSSILSKEADKFPIIKLYIDYKEKNKVVTTYGRNWFDFIHEDGRIHTKYRSMVDTGRTSSGNVKEGPFPNMQNLSSDSDTRSCFCAQKANTLIIGDYTSQEAILMSEFSKEPSLIKFFEDGKGDIYSYTAKQIYPELRDVPVEEIKDKFPKERNMTKKAVFAINYGGNGYTIAENVNIPHEEGNKIYEAYFKAFPKLREYFNKVFDKTMHDGFIELNPITKRKRFLSGLEKIQPLYGNRTFWDKYWQEKEANSKWFKENLEVVKNFNRVKSAIFKLSLNTPIQGSASDMSKIGGILFLKWIIENKKWDSVKIVNFVHDEYVIECNGRAAENIAKVLKEKMEEAANIFTKRLKIKVNPIISKYWKK